MSSIVNLMCYGGNASGRPVDQLDTDDIRRFLAFFITEQHLTASTVNAYRAALRFLFAVILNYLQISRLKHIDAFFDP